MSPTLVLLVLALSQATFALPTCTATVNAQAHTVVARQHLYPAPVDIAPPLPPTSAPSAPEEHQALDEEEGKTYNIVYTTTRFYFPETICDVGSHDDCFRPENAHRTAGSLERVVLTTTSVSYPTPLPTSTFSLPNAFDHPFEAAKLVPKIPPEARPINYEERDYKKLRDGELVDSTGVRVFGYTVLGYSLFGIAFWFACRYKKFRLMMGSREDVKPLEEEDDKRWKEQWDRKQDRKFQRSWARYRARRKEERREKRGKERGWRESEETLTEVPIAVVRSSLRGIGGMVPPMASGSGSQSTPRVRFSGLVTRFTIPNTTVGQPPAPDPSSSSKAPTQRPSRSRSQKKANEPRRKRSFELMPTTSLGE